MEQITQMSVMANKADILRYSGAMSSISQRKQQDDDYEVKPFGKALRTLRKRRKLTQGELAALVGVKGHSTVAGWEQRADPIEDDAMLYGLAVVLGVSVDDLAAGIVRNERVAFASYEEQILAIAPRYLTGARLDFAIKSAKAIMALKEADIERIGWITDMAAEKALAERERAEAQEE